MSTDRAVAIPSVADCDAALQDLDATLALELEGYDAEAKVARDKASEEAMAALAERRREIHAARVAKRKEARGRFAVAKRRINQVRKAAESIVTAVAGPVAGNKGGEGVE